MSRSVAAPRRPDRRPAQTIRRLLDAGAAELRAAPFSALSMRSVAARAELSPASAYTYFPSKNALVANLYLETLKTVALQPNTAIATHTHQNPLTRISMSGGSAPAVPSAKCWIHLIFLVSKQARMRSLRTRSLRTRLQGSGVQAGATKPNARATITAPLRRDRSCAGQYMVPPMQPVVTHASRSASMPFSHHDSGATSP